MSSVDAVPAATNPTDSVDAVPAATNPTDSVEGPRPKEHHVDATVGDDVTVGPEMDSSEEEAQATPEATPEARSTLISAVEQLKRAPGHIKDARQMTRQCAQMSEKAGEKMGAKPWLGHRVLAWGMKKTVSGVGSVVDRSCGEGAGETVRDGLGCATDVVQAGMNLNAVAVKGVKEGAKDLVKGGAKKTLKEAWANRKSRDDQPK